MYKNTVTKYVNDVVAVISKDLISTLNHRSERKYVYRFGKPYLLEHPHVPPSLNNNLHNIYQNDVENIYPVKEIFEALKSKFKDCKVSMSPVNCNITIDWS
jgi:hypothetical protein